MAGDATVAGDGDGGDVGTGDGAERNDNDNNDGKPGEADAVVLAVQLFGKATDTGEVLKALRAIVEAEQAAPLPGEMDRVGTRGSLVAAAKTLREEHPEVWTPDVASAFGATLRSLMTG